MERVLRCFLRGSGVRTQEMQVEALHDISFSPAIVHNMHERNPNTLQIAAS